MQPSIHPFRLIAGIFAAASFWSLINLVTISQPLPACLQHAALCFSVALLPLSIQSIMSWPGGHTLESQEMKKTGLHVLFALQTGVFVAASGVFVVGFLFLISYFGKGAAIGGAFLGLAVLLVRVWQVVKEHSRKRQ
jgi:hypothetical protein